MYKLNVLILSAILAGCSVLGGNEDDNQKYDIRIDVISPEGAHYLNIVEYSTESGMDQAADVITPFVYSYKSNGDTNPSVEAFLAQNEEATVSNPVVCRIYVDGVLEAEDILSTSGSCFATYEF